MAGAGKKTFTAGETLTASDVNTYLMEQSVMVFGGTAARSSAIPTPSEGMTSYRTDTQQIESYDGAAWRGMSGLQLVKTQAIGTGVSTVTVNDAFNANYDNYKIVVSGGTASVQNIIGLRMGTTNTGYYSSRLFVTFNSTTVQSGIQTNTSSFIYAGGQNTTTLHMNVDLLQPFASKQTTYSAITIVPSTTGEMTINGGYLDNTTSYTSFEIFPNGGTLTGGTIYVYGLGK